MRARAEKSRKRLFAVKAQRLLNLAVYSIENYVTATVEGYPSNIIYTAQALENENLMLSGMLDKTDEIVILNYDGDGDYY